MVLFEKTLEQKQDDIIRISTESGNSEPELGYRKRGPGGFVLRSHLDSRGPEPEYSVTIHTDFGFGCNDSVMISNDFGFGCNDSVMICNDL